jgi:hypothetical protein
MSGLILVAAVAALDLCGEYFFTGKPGITRKIFGEIRDTEGME